MSNSINLTAGMRSNLSSLQNLNKALQTTQSRLSTGKKVNSALDDPATFYQASALNQRVSALDRLLDAMGQNMMSIQTANAGIEAGLKTLEQMKQTAQQAASLELLPETRPVETNTAATEAGMTIALRSAPVAAATEVEETTPATQMVFEVGLAHDGKGNTAKLLEKFGDSAKAASWCNQFYAPGVDSNDENFGQGEWYLPAIGELIDAFGEVKPVYYKQTFNYYKTEIISQKFDIDSHQWESCTQSEYDDLYGNYYYKQTRNLNTNQWEYSTITKLEYDDFIEENGHNYDSSQNTRVYSGVRYITNEEAIEKDEYLQLTGNRFILQSYNNVTGQTTYDIINREDWEDFYSSHRSYTYRENNIQYSVTNGTRLEGAECDVETTEEEYNTSKVYFLEIDYYNGIYYDTFINEEEYQELAAQTIAYPDGYIMGRIDNNKIFSANAIYTVRYEATNFDKLNTITDSLANLGFDDPYSAFNGYSRWSSSMGPDTSVWSLSVCYTGGDEGTYEISLGESLYCGAECLIRPFALLENKFTDNEIKPVFGDIMYSDLSYGSADGYWWEGDKTAVGIVTWVSEDGASARITSLANLAAYQWDDSGPIFDPSDPCNYWDWGTLVSFYDGEQWRRDIEGIADVPDLADAYFFGNEAEKAAIYNGKDNTKAMIDTYGDDALAASSCNAFYAPGVAKDDVNFGQGTWYLPAIGEWIEAYGDYQLIGDGEAEFINTDNKDMIDATLDILKNNGGIASPLDGYSYCSSSESTNSQMYVMYDDQPQAGLLYGDGDSTRAFNLIKDQFSDNDISPIVGDVMYSDLSYGSADDYDGTKTAVGVVVWVSEDGASAKIMNLKNLTCYDGRGRPMIESWGEFDPDDPYGNDAWVYNFNNSYGQSHINYVTTINNGIETIAIDELMSVYAASNPGSMVEVPIEPEPEPEPEPTPATQPSAVAEMQKQFAKVNNEFNAIMADSAYNGIGLLKGQNMTVKLNEKAQDNMVIKGFDTANYAIDNDWQSQADIQATITQIERTMAALQAYAQELSNAEQIMQIRQNFNDAMRDILQVGSDNLTLADMNEETANYLAMQTRQQLAINALALAAQSDQSILKLFA